MDKEELMLEEGAEPQKPTFTGLLASVMNDPVKGCYGLISASEAVLNERVPVWQRYWRKYRRGMYYLQRLENGRVQYFTNYMFSNVEATKAHLARNMPPIQVTPVGANDDLAASLMTRFLEVQMDSANAPSVMRAVIHNGLIRTLGWFKIVFDPKRMKTVILSIDTFDMLVDTSCQDPDDCRWFIHRRRDVSEDEILETYGTVPQPAVNTSGDVDEERKDSYFSSGGEVKGRYGMYKAGASQSHGIGKMFDVYECWVRDYSPNRQNDWYVITIAGNTLLHEGPSENYYNDHPFVPWFAGEDYSADNVYYRGIGAIEEVEPLQDQADALDFRLSKHIDLTSNRQKFISAQAGLNPNLVDNTAGRTLVVNGDPRLAVYYDVPPPFSSDVYSFRGGIPDKIQTVSGMFDVTQGRRPTGIIAGRAIESLKESADVRLVDLARLFSEAWQVVGYKVLRTSLQYFDGATILKVMDADQEKIYTIVADYPPELQAFIDPDTGMEMEDDGTLAQQRDEWKTQNSIGLVLSEVSYEYDVRISSDSVLPTNKAELAQALVEYFRLGLIDRIGALQTMSFPGWQKIVERLEGTVTGKDAGNSQEEWATVLSDMLNAAGQVMAQMGLPQQAAQQVLEMMAQASQGALTGQPGGQQQGQQPQNAPGSYQGQIV